MAETARDPDALQQEIERTRGELARTIDAIAERVSPKHAARRGVAMMKQNATHAREAVSERLSRDGRRAARPRALQEGTPQQGAHQQGSPLEGLSQRDGGSSGERPQLSGATAFPAREPGEEPLDVRATTYRVRHTLRKDRVILATGVGLLVITGTVIVWRRSRG